MTAKKFSLKLYVHKTYTDHRLMQKIYYSNTIVLRKSNIAPLYNIIYPYVTTRILI